MGLSATIVAMASAWRGWSMTCRIIHHSTGSAAIPARNGSAWISSVDVGEMEAMARSR